MSDERTESWWDTKLDVDVCEHGRLVGKCEVCELKAEIARLRSVCSNVAESIREVTSGWGIAKRNKIGPIVRDLADAGKEPSDGV